MKTDEENYRRIYEDVCRIIRSYGLDKTKKRASSKVFTGKFKKCEKKPIATGKKREKKSK